MLAGVLIGWLIASRRASRLNDEMETRLRTVFDSLSLEALRRNSTDFIRLAEETLKARTVEGSKELEAKKDLIDRSLLELEKSLADVREKLSGVEKNNAEVSVLFKHHSEITTRLSDNTEGLKRALSSSGRRGQWGERMAEDVIRLSGMIEGVNYAKQKTLDVSTGRPDFTFFMPNGLQINMDVKFPMDNYMKAIEAQTDTEKSAYAGELAKNVKGMIKDVTTRQYINESTVDFVLIFIPNESLYGFIIEADPALMDEALHSRVILCSPFTLYAVLSIVRRSVETFNLHRTTSEILDRMAEFTKQWQAYKEKSKAIGERLSAIQKDYETLQGTRTNMLERPIEKIEAIRRRGLSKDEDEETNNP